MKAILAMQAMFQATPATFQATQAMCYTQPPLLFGCSQNTAFWEIDTYFRMQRQYIYNLEMNGMLLLFQV